METVSELSDKQLKKKKKKKRKSRKVDDVSTRETCSQRRKRKEEREADVDIQCTIADFAATCNTHSRPQGSKQETMSKREVSATGDENGFQNLGKTKNKETDENCQVNEGLVAEIAGGTRSKKHKGRKKKISSADKKTADPSISNLLATVESGPVECLLDRSSKQHVEICDGHAGQDFAGKAQISATGEQMF